MATGGNELAGIFEGHLSTVDAFVTLCARDLSRKMQPDVAELLAVIEAALMFVEVGERRFFLQLVATFITATYPFTYPLRPDPELVRRLWALRVGQHFSPNLRAPKDPHATTRCCLSDDFTIVRGTLTDDPEHNIHQLVALALVWIGSPLTVNLVGHDQPANLGVLTPAVH